MAIPVFFLMIGIEAVMNYVKKKDFYRFNDSVNDLSCGIASQITGTFLKTVLFAGYLYLYNNFRIMEISVSSVIAWSICFIGIDFFYYWFHRMSHEVAVIWGSHAPHHQSEEYNLTVALRQGSFQGVFSFGFYLPLAIVGFPPAMFLVVSQFQTLYQFWIHTRLIGKMGWFEILFNTPSHHRVHHGKNPIYLDRNHGGTLIIFDKMFGTFQAETEEVVFGTVKPLASWNPIWANFQYWLDLAKLTVKAPGFLNKIKVWIEEPGWYPEGVAKDPVPEHGTPEFKKKYDTVIPTGLNIYSLIQFIGVNIATVMFLEIAPKANSLDVYFFGGWVLFSLLTVGGLFELKKWSFYLEVFRLVLTALYFVSGIKESPELSYVSIVAIGMSFGLLVYHYKHFSEANRGSAVRYA